MVAQYGGCDLKSQKGGEEKLREALLRRLGGLTFSSTEMGAQRSLCLASPAATRPLVILHSYCFCGAPTLDTVSEHTNEN